MLNFYLALIDDPSDRLKLERIYNKYGTMMLRAAIYFTGHAYYAEEAVSDALMSMTVSISGIDDTSEQKLSAYVYTVVKCACIDVMKKKNKDIRNVDIAALTHLAAEGDIAAELEAREGYSALLGKINELPEAYKTVLVLKCVNGLSAAEIAKILGVSVNTVNTRLRRGKQKLRLLLNAGGDAL